jgi:hypothetical protein
MTMPSIPRLPLAACALLIGLGAALVVPSAAQAGPSSEFPAESPKHFTTSLSFGSFWLADPNIQASYTDSGKFMTRLNMGFVPWSRYVHTEVSLGIGFLQFPGKAQFTTGGGDSADSVMLTMFPLSVDLLIGVDIVNEQPVVPYGGVGLAWTLWREHRTGGGEEWVGDRMGGSYFFGVGVLLDRLEPQRAARVDARTGINDSYITVEGRYSKVEAQMRDGEWQTDGLRFSGWSLHVGLKLAY